jgi:AcrR family transcriptional regulator
LRQVAELSYTSVVETSVGLRQRHTERTRAAIVAAALELFAERGFQATTVDEIAERAEVAPRTFFRYFPTKEAVLFADARAQREGLVARLAARPVDEHPFLSLTAAVGELADQAARQGESVRLRSRIAAENPAVWAYERTVLEADMADALASFVAGRLGDTGPSDPRPRVWGALVMTTFRIAFQLWRDGGQVGPLRPEVDRALAAAAEALAVLGST